ncbi:hypothetical protein GWN63_05000 [Candidatus Bathyarchaeota archaeon]|nr:hypothetical protein [Candidatus Bathyarchaeota archaeon]NIV68009.1 hypothetical protein [Candidatus Bathyarchaeota archaeon]NIW34547.1 hypothetical protein [Candidatus Bathyarchaeota archaeon]
MADDPSALLMRTLDDLSADAKYLRDRLDSIEARLQDITVREVTYSHSTDKINRLEHRIQSLERMHWKAAGAILGVVLVIEAGVRLFTL